MNSYSEPLDKSFKNRLTCVKGAFHSSAKLSGKLLFSDEKKCS